jgi:hypothetical protein
MESLIGICRQEPVGSLGGKVDCQIIAGALHDGKVAISHGYWSFVVRLPIVHWRQRCERAEYNGLVT